MTEKTKLKIIKKTYPLSISILDITERYVLKKREIYFIRRIINILKKNNLQLKKVLMILIYFKFDYVLVLKDILWC